MAEFLVGGDGSGPSIERFGATGLRRVGVLA